MKKLILTFGGALLVISCACQKQNKESEHKIEQKQVLRPQKISDTIVLKEGETKFLKDKEMNITFTRVVEDSRCPTGVNCIWQGSATVELEFMGTYTRPHTLRLQTIDNDSRGYKTMGVFNSHRIKVVELTPYPTNKKAFNDNTGQYQLGISVEKINLHPRADKATN